jgi:hypothetical protein
MDSDEAITQLMANACSWNPFSLYYWGQDRLGGWPFGIEWLLHKAFGFGWSYRGLYDALAICLLTTVWPLRKLGGWWGWTAASALLGLLTLHEASRHWVLSISQPYAWQMSLFFWAWWLIRRLANADQLEFVSLFRVRAGRWWRFVFPAAFASLLSIWSSPLSAPFLWVVALAETSRVPVERRTGRLWLRLCGVVLIAVVAELAIRFFDQWFAGTHHWRIYWTDVRWDRGHIAENAKVYWDRLRGDPLWPVAAASLPAIGGWFLTRRRPVPAAAQDCIRFAAVCSATGWANALVLVFSSWGRINDYTVRYFSPSWILWTVSCVASLAALIEALPDSSQPLVRRVFRFAGALAIAAAALWVTPPERTAIALERTRLSSELPLLQPDGVLLGCYWGTYSLVDGGAPHALTPVVQHRDTQRTPWTAERLRGVSQAILVQDQCPPLGTPDNPTPFVLEQGVVLALRTPHWLREGSINLSLYDNRSAWLVKDAVSRRGVQEKLDTPLSLAAPASSKGEEAFSVRVTRSGSQLLLFFGSRVSLYLHTPELRAEAVAENGSTRLLAVTSGEHFVSVSLVGVTPPVLIRLINAADPERDSRLEGVAIAP